MYICELDVRWSNKIVSYIIQRYFLSIPITFDNVIKASTILIMKIYEWKTMYILSKAQLLLHFLIL